MTKVGRKPRISVSTTSWFFVIVISTISLLTAWEYARVTDPSGPRHLAKKITVPPGGTAAIELPAAGGHEWMVIEVSADSHFSIRTDGVKVTGGPAANRFSSKTGGEHCGGGEIFCRLPIQKGNRPGTISFFSEDDFQQVTLDVEISLKKFKRATGANGENFSTALLVVCLLVPLVWLTHRSIKVSQWLIVGTATGLLVYIDPIFAACTLLFLISLYRVVRLLEKRTERGGPILFWSLTACVCFLLAFKYGGFLVLSLFPDIGGLALVLPLGLSYFVIRAIDSLLRSYRGDLLVNSFRSYLCYLLFPATIPAGPIMSYDRFHANRLARFDLSDITYGISRILIGVAKKVLIADLLLQRLIFHPDYGVFDSVSMDPGGAAGGVIITYLILNFLFVYVDFSA